MAEIDLDEQVRNGEAISRFLGDDTVKRVIAGLELDYFDEWKEAESVEKREDLRAKACALNDLMKALRTVVADGKLATHQLEQRAKPRLA